jgi:GDPmannose 4,6-dehydratase
MTVALITGVTGQDGRHLAARLSAMGVEVHGVSASSEEPAVDGVVRCHAIDLTRPGIGALISSLRPDRVFNLAAVSSVARSWQDPLTTASVNGLAVAEMLASLAANAEQGDTPRFIQASSAEIFGEARTAPQDESTPIRPVSPYGAAKAYAHHLAGAYRAAGMHASSCILYNHESPLRPEAFVTRKISKAAARISLGLQDTLELGSLEIRRDWGWAPDYVEAMVRVAEHDEPGDYVVATGADHSIEEFVRVAFDRAGVEHWESHVTLSAAFARPADPARLVGDASRARNELGWVPTVGFTEIVHRMVDHDLELERGAAATA